MWLLRQSRQARYSRALLLPGLQFSMVSTSNTGSAYVGGSNVASDGSAGVDYIVTKGAAPISVESQSD